MPASPSTPAYNASGFIALQNPNGTTGLTYDQAHNQIFASNIQRNEVDILSPETMAVVARLPIPQPMGLDVSADGTELIVGTRTHYFYQVSTSSLCVTDREYLPVLPPLNFELSPMHPVALADGSILFGVYDPESTASSVYRWIPGSGFVQPPGLGPLALSVRNLIASGDRQHAYLSGDDSGGEYGRFDLSTGAVIADMVAFGSQPNVLGVNQDGSRALIENDCCGLEVVDSNFNELASQKALFLDNAVQAAPDFSRFYAQDIQQSNTTVLDASLQPIGILPFSLTQQASFTEYGSFDGSRRLIAPAPGGLFLVQTGNVTPLPGATPPVIRFGIEENGAMVPDTPEAGYATTLNGANFVPGPVVDFLAGPNSHVVPGAVTTSTNVISMMAPALASGCFDVEAAFPGGYAALAPLAYCYSPAVDTIDGDAGPEAGGGTLTLYGRGFGSEPSVTIGGAQATNVAVKEIYSGTALSEQSRLTAVVPPGQKGPADIVVSSTTGSLLLKGAYTFVRRQDGALPTGAQPAQLIVDWQRSRILIADEANNRLLIYALESLTPLQQVATGLKPTALALTPDGSDLLVTTAGDNTVTVLDASSYTTLEQATLPATSTSVFSQAPNGPPVQVIALAGKKAVVKTEAGYLNSPTMYNFPFIYEYDLATNTLNSSPLNLSYLFGGSDFSVAASTDGQYALFGNHLLQVAGGTYTQPDLTTNPSADVALNQDGSVNTLDALVLDNAARWQTTLSSPTPIAASPFEEAFFAGAQFNPSGSLLYRATSDHVRLYDTAHGLLARTLEVPGGIVGSLTQRLLAVDPAGQRLVTVTTAGVSVFVFAADPLTISHVLLSGTHFTVEGSGFLQGAALTVDQLPVECTVASTSTLTGSLPALSPGAHAVTVTDPDGSTDTLTLAFRTH